MQFSYKNRLKIDLALWLEKGFLSQTSFDQISKDVSERRSGISFAAVVSLLGVISLCFAAITFVAANWDEMSRLMRVGLLFGGIWLSYAVSAYFHARGQNWLSQTFVLLASALFGASIMLISQMYYLQGEQKNAILMWAVGTLMAALLLRSIPALILAIGLFIMWHWLVVEIWTSRSRFSDINLLYLPVWIISAAGAWWLGSRLAAHVLAIGLMFWLWSGMMTLAELQSDGAFLIGAYLLMLVSISVLLIWRDKFDRWLRGFDQAMLSYLAILVAGCVALWTASISLSDARANAGELEMFLGASQLPLWLIFLVGLALPVFAFFNRREQLYDAAFIALWMLLGIAIGTLLLRDIPFVSEAYALAISVWLIRMGGRQDIHQVTRIGYGFFAAVMLLIYFRTAGSLIGTAGFYLTAGVIMVLGAIFLPKLMDRIGKRGKTSSGAST